MKTLLDSIVLSHPQSNSSDLLRASIIIVNYNAKDKLLRCLASVTCTLPTDCEIIIVDNASVDGSVDAVKAYFPDLTLIQSSINAGFGAGNNLGAELARGKYIVFLNPDTIVERGWVEALIAPLEQNARTGLTTAKILLADEPERINTCGNEVHFTGLTLCRGLRFPRETLNKLEVVGAVSGAAFAIRRELFDSLGGFDGDTFLYMEDTDLSWRARLAGWNCVYTPGSVVFHDYKLRMTSQKVFYQERNRYLMLLKNLRWPTLIVLIPAVLLAELITWGFVLLRDRANYKNKLRAYAWIITNWASIMKKRKEVQSLRRTSDRELLHHTAFKLEFDQVGSGGIVWLARFVFNPIFFVLRSLTMAVVWW